MKKVEKFLEKYSVEVIVNDYLKDDSKLYNSKKFEAEMLKANIDLIKVELFSYTPKAVEIYEVSFIDEDGNILLTKMV